MDRKRKEKRFFRDRNLNAIKLLLEERFVPFIETLSSFQKHTVEMFKKNFSATDDKSVSITKIFSMSVTENRIDSYVTAFLKALNHIREYADFISINNPDKSLSPYIYNYRTAPYFFYVYRSSKYEDSKFMFDLQKEIKEVQEYSLYLLESELINAEADPTTRTIFTLFYKKKNSIHEICIKLNLTIKAVKLILGQIELLAESTLDSQENITKQFLTKSPLERKTILFTFRGFTAEQIAIRLSTTKATVLEARFVTSLGKNPIYKFHSIKELDTSNLNLDLLDDHLKNFIPRHGLLVNLHKIEVLSSSSKYSVGLHHLLTIGRKDLVQLYFLLKELPTVKAIAQISKYEEAYLFKRCAELKKYLGVKDSRRIIDWVEITQLGKMFLTEEIDTTILKIIKKLNTNNTAVTSREIVAFMPLYTRDNVIARLKFLRNLFMIPPQITYGDFPKFIIECTGLNLRRTNDSEEM